MGMMPNPDVALDEKAIVVEAEKALADIATIRQEVAKVIFGQDEVVDQTLITLLSGGHVLLVGVPVGFAVIILVSLVTRPPSAKAQRKALNGKSPSSKRPSPTATKPAPRASTALFGNFIDFMSDQATQIAIGMTSGRNHSARNGAGPARIAWRMPGGL